MVVARVTLHQLMLILGCFARVAAVGEKRDKTFRLCYNFLFLFKQGGVIGSSNQVTENEKIRKWDGERIQVSCTLGITKTELQLKYTGLLYTVVELN